jgi:Tol biopolymer transport system component
MTIQRELQHLLRAHLEERADRTVADGQLAAILDTTARRRQRPAWLAALRSPSMNVITLERPAAPRAAWAVLALALLVLALVATLLVAGAKLGRPPTNGQIVFGRYDATQGDTVPYVVNPDGTGLRQLVPFIAEGPFWSPDGKQIGLGHAVIDADGTNLRTWDQSGNPFKVECWDWSPDGARMLCEGFSDDQAANVQIHGVYTVRASDGRDLIRVSRVGDGGTPGVYSPDGTMIAYTGLAPEGNVDAIDALMLVNVDGSNPRRLGRLQALEPGDMSWSPDGQSILVSSQGTVYRVTVATGQAVTVRIANDPAAVINGARWSPDGTRILFKRYMGGASPNPNMDLYTMRLDGTDVIRVTNDPDDDRFVDWGVHPLQ